MKYWFLCLKKISHFSTWRSDCFGWIKHRSYIWSNFFWVFENFRSKNSQTASVNRSRYFSFEIILKRWMFFTVNDTTNSFMKSEYSVIQSCAVMHPCKWTITDNYLKKLLRTMDPNYNNLWRGHEILLDIEQVRKYLQHWMSL